MTNYRIKYEMPRFFELEIPVGFLDPHPACHALWRYYLSARQTWETHVKDVIVLEGEKDPAYDFKQLFTSIAQAYGVQPEHMVKFWPNVDMQCVSLALPKLPDEDQYRFNRIAEVRTQ